VRPLSERVVVVLVQPLHPGNVGAAARAMRNFGLERLVLVDPPAYDPERARWMAPGCADLLGNARIVATLDEALEGVQHVLGTTARHRKLGHTILEPAPAAAQICDQDLTTALLFGREDFGLSNEAIARCGSLVRIATPEHASLNLGQAVLLVAHHLFEEERRRGAAAPGRTLGGSRRTRSTANAVSRSRRDEVADVNALEPAVADLLALLLRVGYLRGVSPEKVSVTARQALQQAELTVKQVEALRGMVGRVDWALDHPEVDPAKTRREH
jgi:tRNA (cytidine32/uridine32-2'-O)-methyltransferase